MTTPDIYENYANWAKEYQKIPSKELELDFFDYPYSSKPGSAGSAGSMGSIMRREMKKMVDEINKLKKRVFELEGRNGIK